MTAEFVQRIFQAAVVATILLPTACQRAPGPLSQGVYVWQRNFSPEVAEALTTIPCDEPCLLWREMTFQPSGVTRTPVAPDLPSLARSATKAGFAIRIPSAPNGLGSDPSHLEAVSGEINRILQETAQAGIAVTEIQIDYDCPTRLLPVYAKFLADLSKRHDSIVPTALPAWIGQPGWREFARAASGFVLQLHSLEVPDPAAGEAPLFDPVPARGAIDRAAREGVPFRIALPTYESLAIFDAEGRLVAIESEAISRDLPANGRAVRCFSDPLALAAFVSEIQRGHPENLRGIFWYRLPVASDRRNWSAVTLTAVMAGRQPTAAIEISQEPMPNGAERIVATSSGEMPAELPRKIRIEDRADTLLAYDALPPYKAEILEGALIFSLDQNSSRRLRDGESRTLGWIRRKPASPAP